MSYRLSEFEEALTTTVAEIVRKEAPLSTADPSASRRPELWAHFAVELGWAGVALPEEFGGAGASYAELCLIVQELGAELVGVPIAESAVVALALAEGAPEPLRSDVVAELAAGTAPATLVSGRELDARDDGGSLVLSGAAAPAIGAADARWLLVFADGASGSVLAIVDRNTATGITERGLSVADHTRAVATLEFEATTIESSAVVARGSEARAAWARARARHGVALAAESAGMARRCLDLANEYAAARVQFGRVIGSYQAVKHLLADAVVASEQAKVAARHAAVASADDPAFLSDAATALLFCTDVAIRNAETCFQVHGGIAFTSEHPAHLYYRRAQVNRHIGSLVGEGRDFLGSEIAASASR